MDKISSYPSGILEDDARAGSYRAPRVYSPGKARWMAPTWESLGPKSLGPFAPSLGKPNMIGAILYVWAGHYGPISQTWNNSKTAPISE